VDRLPNEAEIDGYPPDEVAPHSLSFSSHVPPSAAVRSGCRRCITNVAGERNRVEPGAHASPPLTRTVACAIQKHAAAVEDYLPRRETRTPNRWRLRPPPPQAFRLALRLPRTTRKRGFNLEALRARCSANLGQESSSRNPPLAKIPATSEENSRCQGQLGSETRPRRSSLVTV
jgi:hypothetical protein